MIDVISGLFATIVTVPFIALIGIYYVTYVISKNKKKSFHMTVDISTFFFIIAVATLMFVIWERSFLWIICLFLVGVAMIIIFIQWKVFEEIKFRKFWKGYWRINFLLFSTSYVTLLIYGLIRRIFA